MNPLKNITIADDVLINHFNTLYHPGAKTLPAVLDLLEFCQRAVLTDTVLVSPTAYQHCDLLRALDFVQAPSIRISEAADEEEADSSAEPTIEIDLDERGNLFSRELMGQCLLVAAFAEVLQDDELLGALVRPVPVAGFKNHALRSLIKVAFLMLSAQVRRDLLEFESDESRRYFLEMVGNSVSAYERLAKAAWTLQSRFAVHVARSVLEQPAFECFVMDETTAPVERSDEIDRLRRAIDRNLKELPGRAEFFERWRLPPLGILVLSEIRSLDDVPAVIASMRQRFAKPREKVWQLTRLKREALEAAGEFSVKAEKIALEVGRIEEELARVYEAFDEEVREGRKWRSSHEVVFRLWDYTCSFAGGLGIGSLDKLTEVLGLKRRALLQRVPGMFGLASLIRDTDNVLATGVVQKLLGDRMEHAAGEARFLELAFEHGQHYARHRVHDAPAELEAMEIAPEGQEPTKISDRRFWSLFLQVDGFQRLFVEDPTV